jgi:hypothetical protein
VHTRLGLGGEEGNKSGKKAVSYGPGSTKKLKRKWLRIAQQRKPKESRTKETRGKKEREEKRVKEEKKVIEKTEWSMRIRADECMEGEGKCIRKKWNPKPRQRRLRIMDITKNVSVVF